MPRKIKKVQLQPLPNSQAVQPLSLPLPRQVESESKAQPTDAVVGPAPYVDNEPNPYVEADLPEQIDRVIYALPVEQLNNVIRAIRTTSTTSVEQLRTVLSKHVAGLDIGTCVPLEGIPPGSDQVDMMSLFVWAGRVRPQDNDAKAQIGQLYATCLRRLGEPWPDSLVSERTL